MPKQPKILTRLKRQLREQGMTGPKVQKIAVSALQKAGNLKADSTATAKGVKRGNMTARARAADRARKYSRGTTVTKSKG